jgi:hypothetical protein
VDSGKIRYRIQRVRRKIAYVWIIDMKVNLFNGIILFEGSARELKQLIKEMPELNRKLIDLQLATNDSIVKHQSEMAKIIPAGMKNNPGPYSG